MTNFKKMKEFLVNLIDDVDVAQGRSRVAVVLFSGEPTLYFDFDRYYSPPAVKGSFPSSVLSRRIP